MSERNDTALMWGRRNQFRLVARDLYGVKCAACRKREPKRDATILLPGQRCYCGYVDPREKLTLKAKRELEREVK